MEWYKSFSVFERCVVWIAGTVILCAIVFWIFHIQVMGYKLSFLGVPINLEKAQKFIPQGDKLNFIGALISALATSLIVLFIWWRDKKTARQNKRGTLYAFYGHICSVQENLMEQQVIFHGLIRHYQGGEPGSIVYIPTYKMPSLEHSLQIYAYVPDSPIFSRLIIELECCIKTLELQKSIKTDIICRVKAVALCELIKRELTGYLPNIKWKIANPIDNIKELYKISKQSDLDKVLPQESIIKQYKNAFLP